MERGEILFLDYQQYTPGLEYHTLEVSLSKIIMKFAHLDFRNYLLSHQQIEYFQLAVTYQLLHAITLVGVSMAAVFIHSRLIRISQLAFVLGISFFSGSLYLYVFTGTKVLGMITPIGGLLLIIAWLLFAASLIRKSSTC